MAKVRIVLTKHGRGEVYLDDAKLPGVRALYVSAEVDATNRVTLEFVPDQIEIEGEFDVSTVESPAHRVLKVAAGG